MLWSYLQKIWIYLFDLLDLLHAPPHSNTPLPLAQPKVTCTTNLRKTANRTRHLALASKVLRQNMTNSAKQNRKQLQTLTLRSEQNAYKHAPSIYLHTVYIYTYIYMWHAAKVYLISRPPSGFLRVRRARMQILRNRQGANFLKFPTLSARKRELWLALP